MSGALVFSRTRVPLKNLFDYLETGESIEDFLTDFPTVSKEQVAEVLKISEDLLFNALGTDAHRS
jgi:uncharacterized protein (DUF433 family)